MPNPTVALGDRLIAIQMTGHGEGVYPPPREADEVDVTHWVLSIDPTVSIPIEGIGERRVDGQEWKLEKAVEGAIADLPVTVEMHPFDARVFAHFTEESVGGCLVVHGAGQAEGDGTHLAITVPIPLSPDVGGVIDLRRRGGQIRRCSAGAKPHRDPKPGQTTKHPGPLLIDVERLKA